ncbi:hypothetical protein CVT26_008779 [Gymnopilus dilepis]|uniref:Uncharacterized protein n=1 Tax=Gymnopilus dilepis TaxID=231916 RepID=A0A409W9J9_9AGAR|nr:hypothetical protein CVT26_008779 [Gymnopilus dilepis]
MIFTPNADGLKIPKATVFLGGGVQVTFGPSATGLGTHIRWTYDEAPKLIGSRAAEQEARKQQASSALYRACFGGSQSSLSSISSSGSVSSSASFSSVGDDDFFGRASSTSSATSCEEVAAQLCLDERSWSPSPPPCPRPRRERVASLTPKKSVLGSTGPSSPARALKSKQRLVRSPSQRWTRNNHGDLVAVGPSRAPIGPSAPLVPPQSSPIDFNLISFMNAEKLLHERDAMQRILQEYDDSDIEDRDMIKDAMKMREASTPKVKRFGSHGTELIDSEEEFIPDSGSKLVYPQAWVDRRSTALRAVPTEPL